MSDYEGLAEVDLTVQEAERDAAKLAAELDRDEFKALKDEQRARMSFRDGLITSFGSLIAASVVAGQTGMYDLLLIVAPFCAIVGWNRIGQDIRVSLIKHYIRTDLGPRQSRRVGGQTVYGWENIEAPKRRTVKIIQLGADLTTFAAPGIVANLVWATHGPHNPATQTGAIISTAFTGLIIWLLTDNSDIPPRRRR